MPRPLAPLAVAALCVLAIGAAPAAAATQTASSGPVTATFRFHRVDDLRYRHLRLTIQLSGQTIFDRPAKTADCAEPFCAPGGGVGGDSVRVRNLDGADPPDVLLDLFTGGAHCCVESELVALSDTGAGLRVVQHDWGDPGYRLRDLDRDGVDEFLTADDRFAYLFTAYAFSALPVRILSFRGGGFADVTDRYLGRVRADARHWRRAYHRTRADLYPQGILAAWAGDEYRLGRRAAALRFVRHDARRGKLRTAMGERRAQRVARRLDRTLRRFGY
jgi:hypothetical protein